MITQTAGIAFYNLENFFDTIPNNPLGRDLEYTPNGKNQWDSRKYRNKVNNLARAISSFTSKRTPSISGIFWVCMPLALQPFWLADARCVRSFWQPRKE